MFFNLPFLVWKFSKLYNPFYVLKYYVIYLITWIFCSLNWNTMLILFLFHKISLMRNVWYIRIRTGIKYVFVYIWINNMANFRFVMLSLVTIFYIWYFKSTSLPQLYIYIWQTIYTCDYLGSIRHKGDHSIF